MAKYNGMGWHNQSIRHSNARKYGKAGGIYAGTYTPQSITQRKKPANERISDDALRLMYYYRLVWFRATGKKSQNGLFEKFMTSAFPDRQYPDYADEWARRFMTGNPTVYMDSKRKKIYMDLLKKDDVYDETLFVKEGKIEDEWTEKIEKAIEEQKK